ncbi:hypothetical protein R1flu_020449 [Riccia fluitans]|uniref:Uncharacterized protein n=1 Tax=Riccia fluitans TaxID=41844 RepID=A0ABD1ZLJ5_9MARC
MYQFFNTLHVPPLNNCPINEHTGRPDCQEVDDSEMYEEDISGSFGSPFDFDISVSNIPVRDGPSSHGTSCNAGPEEVGAINNPAVDNILASPSLSIPNNADRGKSCLMDKSWQGIRP